MKKMTNEKYDNEKKMKIMMVKMDFDKIFLKTWMSGSTTIFEMEEIFSRMEMA